MPKDRVHRFALLIYLVYSTFLLAYLLTATIFPNPNLHLLIISGPISLSLVSSVFAFVLTKRNHIEIGTWIFCIGVLLSITIASTLIPPSAPIIYSYSVVPILISSFILAPKVTFLMTMIHIASGITCSLLVPEIPRLFDINLSYVLIISLLIIIIQFARKEELEELTKTQRQLVKSEETLRYSLDATGDGSWDCDLSSGQFFLSGRWLEMFGYASHDISTLDDITHLIHPADLARVKGHFEEHYQSQSDRFEDKFRLRNKSGFYQWVLSRGKIVSWQDNGPPHRILGTVTDISLDMKHQLALIESERKLIEAQAIANIGSWQYHIKQEKFSWTEQMFVIFGSDSRAGEPFLKDFKRIFHPEDQSRWIACFENGIKFGHPFMITCRILHPVKGVVHVKTHGRGIYNEKSELDSIQGTCQDITEMIRQQNELEEAMKKANQAVEVKAAFLANMSHEIRTPLNGLLGYAELLYYTNLDSKQRQYLQILQKAGHHLLGVVNDILDFSKIESGNIQIENQAFNLAEKLKSTISIYRIQALAKDLKLSLIIDENTPKIVNSDEFRISQILTNLLSNAIKFTDSGMIEVRVKRQEKSPEGLSIQIEVEDTGIGISESDQLKLFQSFSQVDSSISRKYGGTGLGLTIAKKLSQLLGGDLWYQRKKEQGSIFGFNFRSTIVNALPQDSDSYKQIDPLFSAQSNFPMKILVAEDNPINQQLVKAFLKKLGFEADLVANGQEAIKAQNQVGYDLIFMDMQMPEMDGIQATKKLRETWSSQELKIVAMTASAMESDKEQCFQVGMDDFISKPFSKSDLERVFHRFQYEWAKASDNDQQRKFC